MSRKPTPPLIKHAKHETQVREGRGPHPGQLWCVKCKKHIVWLSQRDYDTLTKGKTINP